MVRAQGSGRTWPQPFAIFHLGSSSWRTSPGSATGDSTGYSATWPKQGMTRAGRAYELPTLVPRTAASASSSWRGLPTPRATDGTKGGPNQRGSRGDLMLPSAVVRLLPTAQARDGKGAAPNSRGADLNEAVRLLATPTSNLGTRGGSQPPAKRRAGGHSVTLADQVEHQGFVADADVPELRGAERGHQGRRPGSAVGGDAAGRVEWGEYEPAIRLWEVVSGPVPAPVEPGLKTGLRLAPGFVEWMQGLRPGWVTDLGFSRRAAFRLLGNTVVPQQAVAALQVLDARRRGVSPGDGDN